MKARANKVPTQKPLSYTDYLMNLGDLSLDEIVGQKEAIDELKILVESIRYKTIYNIWNVKTAKGILLTGGTGLGKTASVRALAKELSRDVVLMELKYLDIASRWIDAPIEHLKQFFKVAEEKSKEKHVVIFIDEIDAMIPDRESGNLHETSVKRVDVFLEWMDGGLGAIGNITIIGATNFEQGVDVAAKRPGRFDKILEYKEFDSEAILKGLQIHLGKKKLTDDQLDVIDWDLVSSKIKDGIFSGADLPEIINRIIVNKVNRHITNLRDMVDFDQMKDTEQEKHITKVEYFPTKITTSDVVRAIKEYKAYRSIGEEAMAMGFAAQQAT